MTKPSIVKGYSPCVEVNTLIDQLDDVVKSYWTRLGNCMSSQDSHEVGVYVMYLKCLTLIMNLIITLISFIYICIYIFI